MNSIIRRYQAAAAAAAVSDAATWYVR